MVVVYFSFSVTQLPDKLQEELDGRLQLGMGLRPTSTPEVLPVLSHQVCPIPWAGLWASLRSPFEGACLFREMPSYVVHRF